MYVRLGNKGHIAYMLDVYFLVVEASLQIFETEIEALPSVATKGVGCVYLVFIANINTWNIVMKSLVEKLHSKNLYIKEFPTLYNQNAKNESVK